MVALAVLLLPLLGAGISSSCLTFVLPHGNTHSRGENHIPEGMATSEMEVPWGNWKMCWLQAGGFSKVWTTAEGEGCGRRRDLQGRGDGAELRKEAGIWKKE